MLFHYHNHSKASVVGGNSLLLRGRPLSTIIYRGVHRYTAEHFFITVPQNRHHKTYMPIPFVYGTSKWLVFIQRQFNNLGF